MNASSLGLGTLSIHDRRFATEKDQSPPSWAWAPTLRTVTTRSRRGCARRRDSGLRQPNYRFVLGGCGHRGPKHQVAQCGHNQDSTEHQGRSTDRFASDISESGQEMAILSLRRFVRSTTVRRGTDRQRHNAEKHDYQRGNRAAAPTRHRSRVPGPTGGVDIAELGWARSVRPRFGSRQKITGA